MSMKVLVAGDVEGNIANLFKKVESVNKKVNIVVIGLGGVSDGSVRVKLDTDFGW